MLENISDRLGTKNLRFPGQYYDQETGLHYNFFRDYDPSTGRYVESDPIGLDGGLNTYVYIDNQPLSYIDPLGLVHWTGTALVGRAGIKKKLNIGRWKTPFGISASIASVHLDLTSDCIDSMQTTVHLDVGDIDGKWTSALPIFFFYGDVDLRDENQHPEPMALTGSFSMRGAVTGVGGGDLKTGIAYGVFRADIGLAAKFNIKGISYYSSPPETHCCTGGAN